MDPQRILIVDDDPALIEGLTAALCPPYEVRSASAPASALALVAADRFDLILLDLVLGNEDGLDLMPRLRAMTRAPVLLLTAFGTRENLVRIVRAKPDDYLEKPFGLAELRTAVAALLRGVTPAAGALERARAIIEREYDRPLTLVGLARRVGMSARRLQRDFRHRFGTTPAAFLVECRMRRAASQLRDPQRLVKEVAASVGFPNPNNFATAFKRHHGVSPRVFRMQPRPSESQPHGSAGT
jgi:DNA-binding response OmpR family regulator